MHIVNTSVAIVMEHAHSAYLAWRNSELAERAKVLQNVATYYDSHRDELAAAIAEDMGKPIAQGRAEVDTCALIYRYYSENAEILLKPERIESRQDARLELRPTGVILGVMPWNFPHYQLARLIAPNLLIGNGVVFKHSSLCQLSARSIETMVRESGAPDGLVINSSFTHSQVTEAIGHDAITGVALTGGETAGSAVAASAGMHLKKSVMELGGNDPFIAFDTGRAPEIAKLAAKQRLFNGGQTCVSPKRVIVHTAVFDEFVEAYESTFFSATPGDPLDDQTVLGPLSSDSAAQELRDVLKQAQADGIELRGNLSELDRTGRNFSPILIVNPDMAHSLWKTELFGPITMIVRADSVAEAIQIANDSPYGLGATVFTNQPGSEELFARDLDCGMVTINCLKDNNPAYPFGGVKRSGFGRELGASALREFANQKLVILPSSSAGEASSST